MIKGWVGKNSENWLCDRSIWQHFIQGEYHFNLTLTLWCRHILSLLFSCSVMSDSLWPHGLQLTRLPYLSPNHRAYSNSCPLSWWCHPTISSSVTLFFSHPQSFQASGSFPMSRLFTTGGQNIGTSSSALVLPMILGGFPLGLTDLLAVQGTLKNLCAILL